MNNKNKPTMFIDTVSTEVKSTSSQVYYDSRNKQNDVKWDKPKSTSLIEKKLDGILGIVNKGNKINIYLELEDTYVEGLIKERRGNEVILSIYNKEEAININKIKDVIILNN